LKLKTTFLFLVLSTVLCNTDARASKWLGVYAGISQGTGKGFNNYKPTPILLSGDLAFESTGGFQLGVEYTHSVAETKSGVPGYIGTLFLFVRVPLMSGFGIKLAGGTGKSDIGPFSNRPLIGGGAGLWNDFTIIPTLFRFRFEGGARVIQPGGLSFNRAIMYDVKGGLVLSI